MTNLFDQLAAELGPTYRLERELGGGGMSRVFLAEEPRLGRRVVVKVLPPEASAGLPADRFEREIRLAASLQHPGLVPVLNAGAAAGLVYYVMPYIDGESLAARIAREGALPVGDAVRILRDAAEALAYAHAQGVVHRDVKPDNILLTGRRAVMTDFGVAKAVNAAAGGERRSTLTEAGFTLGTPAYMAPEQATADPHLDHRADLYALGVVAYEMLAGRLPFSAPTSQGMIAAHVATVPEPVDRYRAGIPAELSALVMRCLEKHPADRPQDAEALLGALDAVGTAPSAAHATARVPAAAPSRPVALLAVAAVVVTALAFALTRVAGLPDWVWIGALALMLAGLPVIIHTGRLERRREEARATGSYHPSGEPVAHRLFTWRRAVLGGGLALAMLGVAVVGWAASRKLGIGPAATLLSAGSLDSRDRLVLADFANRTADSTLGDAVTEALRVDLGQSRVVRLLDQRQVAATLQRMGGARDASLTEALAREVALREGAKAVVTGEVTPLGSGYVLTARIVTADSGVTLAPVRVTAQDPGELIAAVNELSVELRSRIGESLRTIRASEPLARVTTASLPALRLYTEGSRAFAAGDYLAARDYLERAVAADSGFAMAWRRLGAAYYNTGAPVSQRLDAARRAFRHRDRLPPLERLLTEGYYHTDADPRPERAIAAYQAALDLVPDEMIAVNNLGLLLNREGRFAEAEEVLRRGIAAGGPATLLTNLNYSLISQKKWAAIDSLIAYADTGLPPGHHVRLTLRLDAAAGRRDYAQLHALLDTVAAPPTGLPEWVLLWERATALEAQGRFAEAVRTTAEIARLATEEGNAPLAADAVLEPVLQAYFRGDPAAARAELARVLGGPVYRELPDSLLPAGFLGIIYGAVGDPAGVRRMRELWERAHLEGGATRADSLSWIGHLAHAERRWRDAAEAYGGAHEARHCAPCGVFLAAHMWDMAGVPDSAAAWYRRGLDLAVTEENAEDAFFHPIALRRLGEIAEEQGRAAEALEWYQRFVDVWRDADPELQPVVRGARERIARLTAEPR